MLCVFYVLCLCVAGDKSRKRKVEFESKSQSSSIIVHVLTEDAGKCLYGAYGILPIPALICTDDLQTL